MSGLLVVYSVWTCWI